MGKYVAGWFCLALWALGAGGFAPARLHAQVPPVASDTIHLGDTLPFAAQMLEGPWRCTTLGRSFQVPFQLAADSNLTFYYDFSWPERAPDTLYIQWSGVAWEAELLLDDYYLGIHRRSFEPWEVWVARDWVQPGTRLWLTLHPGGEASPLRWPQLGIFRPVRLSATSASSAILAEWPEADPAQPVGLVAPYFREHGLIFDSLRALQALLPLLDEGIGQVAFWYGPGPRLLGLCQSLGLEPVRLHPEVARVGLVNWYPHREVAEQKHLPFWLDEQGYRRPTYGRWVDWPSLKPGLPPVDDRLGLGLLLLLPLLGVFLIKLLGPGFFNAQPQLLTSPAMFLENSFSSASLGGSMLVTLTLVRLLISSALVTLLAYALHWYQGWAWLEQGTGTAWLHAVQADYDSLGALFGVVSGLVWGVEAAKLVIFSVMGQVFRLRGLVVGMLSLDVVRHYPLLMLLPVGVGLWLFWGESYRWVIEGGLLLLLLIYGLRKIYVGFIGLDRGLSFSLGLKVLYICTLDIATLLIWL